MSWASTVAAIRAHFSGEFVGAAIHPENAGSPPGSGAPTVILSIVTGDRQQTGLGNNERWYETTGMLEHELYLPAGSGTAAAEAIADEIESVWLAAYIAGVKLYETQRPVYLGQQGPWYRANVSTRFLIQDQATIPQVGVRMITGSFPSHAFVAAPAAFAWSSGTPVAVALSASSTGAAGVVVRIDPDDSQRLTLALDGQPVRMLEGHGLGAVGPRWINAAGAITASEPSGLKQLVLEVVSSTLFHVRIGVPYA